MGSIFEATVNWSAAWLGKNVMTFVSAFVIAIVTATSPGSANPQTPLNFLLQIFNPSSYTSMPTVWNLSTAPTRAARAPAPAQASLQQPDLPNEEHLNRRLVSVSLNQAPGTVIVDTNHRFLYLMVEDSLAIRYGIGVGRQGFEWNGETRVGRKVEWPDWIPPKEMREREPWLPERMEGGLENPLGARALYLFEGGTDTLYRIHGTNQPQTIGQALSSGCIRMLNDDVMDLYQRVPIGAKVIVL